MTIDSINFILQFQNITMMLSKIVTFTSREVLLFIFFDLCECDKYSCNSLHTEINRS